MPIRKQASCAKRFAISVKGNSMDRHGIHIVPFKFFRDALLHDEDFKADRTGMAANRFPVAGECAGNHEAPEEVITNNTRQKHQTPHNRKTKTISLSAWP